MSKSVAIIGASANRTKFGNKAVRAFGDKGWDVYPVNPTAQEIEGLKVYASIAEVPVSIDRVSMYVPPTIGVTMLESIAAKGAEEVFINPGAGSAELIAKAEQLGLNVVSACSIVDIGLQPSMYADE